MDNFIHRYKLLKVYLYKSFIIYLIVAFICYVSPLPYAYANPVGGVVSSGDASISSAGNTLTVDQTSSKAVVDWTSFNISSGETTRFNQPSSSSITLNRIGDTSASQIFGSLTANGNIILLNPNGILFGTNSRVDVNGIVASTASISNANFMAGTMNFTNSGGSSSATITNQGTITAADAGLVGLVAPNVNNSGVITARLGQVHLASGNSFTLDMFGDGLLEIGVSDDVTAQLVRNTGEINAAGGIIKMTAAATRSAVNSLIEVGGRLNAPSVAQRNGKIYIYAEGSNNTAKTGSSTVTVSGNLNTTGVAAGQTGGNIDVLGDNVAILSGAVLDASGAAGGGTIRIGGDYQGGGTVANALHTVIESGSLISSDALSSGNGGKVIVWADNRTDFNGKISAKGGANGGDGGFVETSGKQVLSVGGQVDASSALGAAGQWLLDPNNVLIKSTGTNTNVSGNPFATTNDNAIVTTSSIQNALNLGTNVSITTGSSGSNSQLGNITVANSITKSAGGDASLTLQAVGSIIINSGANIITNSNKLNIILNANSTGSTTTGGAITITGATLNSGGGNILLGGGVNAEGSAYGTSVYASGITLSNATLNSGAGDITLRGNGANINTANHYGVSISAASVITATSGNINVAGIGGNGTSGNYGVYVTGANSAVRSTGSGNVTVTGKGGNGTTANHGVYVAAAGKISLAATSTGTLNVTGTGGTNGSISTNKNNYGVFVTGTGSAISSSRTSGAGNVTVTGSGANGFSSNYGIALSSGGSLTTVVDKLTINGFGGDGKSTGNWGVYVAGNITSTGSGNIEINAAGKTGAAFNATSKAQDIYLTTGANISGGSGMVSLNTAGTGIINVATAQTIKTSGGAILLNGPISLANNLTVDSTNVGANVAGGNITFAGTINGARVLTVKGGTSGLTSINGIVGGTTALSSVNIESGGGVAFNKSVKASTILANTTRGIEGDIKIGAGAVLNATATSGNSIILASGGNFINNGGSGALVKASKARWLVYSTSPENDVLGGLARPVKSYNKTYASYAPTMVTQTGNVFLYSIAPILNVTANDVTMDFGSQIPALTQNITGLIDNDLSSVAYTGLGGTPTTLANNESAAGSYAINASPGTLAVTNLGYQIKYVAGTLTIKQPILPDTGTPTTDDTSTTNSAVNPPVIINADTSLVNTETATAVAVANLANIANIADVVSRINTQVNSAPVVNSNIASLVTFAPINNIEPINNIFTANKVQLTTKQDVNTNIAVNPTFANAQLASSNYIQSQQQKIDPKIKAELALANNPSFSDGDLVASSSFKK